MWDVVYSQSNTCGSILSELQLSDISVHCIRVHCAKLCTIGTIDMPVVCVQWIEINREKQVSKRIPVEAEQKYLLLLLCQPKF